MALGNGKDVLDQSLNLLENLDLSSTEIQVKSKCAGFQSTNFFWGEFK